MISIRDLSFSYLKPDGSKLTETNLLNRVNLDIAEGEFVLVCGPTGSGKSTLLKALNGLSPGFTGGVLSGELFLDNIDFTGKPAHDFAHMVGYVNQQPEGSFVADVVIDEIVYGAEQLGLSRSIISENLNRICEILDIENLIERNLETLSGGQQQRVAIAAALIAGQKILLLDEPTSALDQKATAKILRTLKELAKDHGITVLLAEHRISRVIAEVDSLLVVHGDGSVNKGPVSTQFKDSRFAPPIIELGLKLNWAPLPIDMLAAGEFWKESPSAYRQLSPSARGNVMVSISDLSVSFDNVPALDIPDLRIFGNQVTAVMGANGSGKTTLCWEIQGLGARQSGEVIVCGIPSETIEKNGRLDLVAMVPQRAADLLFLNTLAEEFAQSDEVANAESGTTAALFQNLTGRLDASLHPRDLSQGQQLALVLAMQLAKAPRVLILDEPTRGLDYAAKKALAKQLHSIRNNSRSIILASHDVEFVAMVADRVLILDDGKIIQDDLVTEIIGPFGSLPSQVAQITKTKGLISAEQVIA